MICIDLHCICNGLNLTFVHTGSLVSYRVAVCLLIVGSRGGVVVAGGGDWHFSEYLCLIHIYICDPIVVVFRLTLFV